MQPHSEATVPAQHTPADLAHTVQLAQNLLPVAKRIPKFPVVLNAAADRTDRPCHSKVMGSTETTLKRFGFKGGTEGVNLSSHWG